MRLAWLCCEMTPPQVSNYTTWQNSNPAINLFLFSACLSCERSHTCWNTATVCLSIQHSTRRQTHIHTGKLSKRMNLHNHSHTLTQRLVLSVIYLYSRILYSKLHIHAATQMNCRYYSMKISRLPVTKKNEELEPPTCDVGNSLHLTPPAVV